MNCTKVLIVDDHEIVRRGLCEILSMSEGLSIVGDVGDSAQALDFVKRTQPDVVLMDIMMPDLDGISTSRLIRDSWPDTKVIILTAIQSEKEVFAALSAGVAGYLHKDVGASELINAITTVADGQSLFDSEVAKIVMGQFAQPQLDPAIPKPAKHFSLTNREHEVLVLMAKGCRNKDIAQKLFISEKTVKTHVSSILRKLDQRDRTQAVLHAIRTGMIDEGEEPIN